EEWMQHVPRAAADDDGPSLDGAVTVSEVRHTLFGLSMAASDEFTPCHPSCVPCGDTARELAAWRDSSCSVAPSYSPCLHTSVASGPDCMPAEILCWPHFDSAAETNAFRMRVSDAVASVLNKALSEGTMTMELAEVLVTPIIKAAKPGFAIDASLPDFYRGISVGNVLPKVLSIIIARRLAHWAIWHHILLPSQIGFLYRHSAEWHVFTLTEALKQRMRTGKRTCVLFVDLRKAYDSV